MKNNLIEIAHHNSFSSSQKKHKIDVVDKQMMDVIKFMWKQFVSSRIFSSTHKNT